MVKYDMSKNKNYYLNSYEKIMKSGITNIIFRHHHKMIESKFTNKHFHNILEIASYDDSHLEYVKCTYDNYVLSDINPIVMKNQDNSLNEKIKTLVLNVEDLTQLPTDSFDRVIMGCIISHVKDIEKLLFEVKRITKDKGFISIYVPCEPGLILRIARSLINVPRNYVHFSKNHYSLVYSEHKIHILAMKHAIRETFFRGGSRENISRLNF